MLERLTDNIDGLFKSAATVLMACARSSNIVPTASIYEAFDVALILQSLVGFSKAPDQEIHDFSVPGLNENFHLCWEGERCNDVLDALVAAEPIQTPDADSLYDLALYKASVSIVLRLSLLEYLANETS